MKKPIHHFVGVSFVFILFINHSVVAESDRQLWTDQFISGQAAEGWTVGLKQQERWVDDMGTFQHYHTEFSATRSIHSGLSLGLQYRQQFIKRNDNWQDENRPVGTVTLKGKAYGLKWQNRSRFEVRFRDGRDTLLNYRNRMMLSRAKGGGVTPYAFDEFFIDSDQGELYRNRLACGLKSMVAEPVELNVYAMWQVTDQAAGWADTFVMGARLGWKF